MVDHYHLYGKNWDVNDQRTTPPTNSMTQIGVRFADGWAENEPMG